VKELILSSDSRLAENSGEVLRSHRIHEKWEV
jgi:hypothetical protein